MIENNSELASFKLTDDGVLCCIGEWTQTGIGTLSLDLLSVLTHRKCNQIDGSQIQQMDSAGAVLINECIQTLEKKEQSVQLTSFKEEYDALIQLVKEYESSLDIELEPPKRSFLNRLGFYTIGKETVEKYEQVTHFLSFFGEFIINFLNELKKPARIQWMTVLNIIEETGYRAMPIIGLLLFLIGIVLTYQMGLQLKNYGANVFIVNLSGIAILREFAPLITAIIVAGRTSSSFTALISTMKVYEEIDALSVMGLSPMNRIVLPRVLGLLISLPLLTIWACIFGVLGSMVMANNMLEKISYANFLERFGEVVEFKEYWIGMSKTPVFALIISIIGCYQGFAGSLSADSVGRQTTKSVVQAIFLIIIADSAFSVAYSWLGL